MINFGRISKEIINTADRNSPGLLTALAVAGAATSVILAVKGTIQAVEIVQQEASFRIREWEQQTEEDGAAYPSNEVVSKKEVVELTWKCYIPTGVMLLTTFTCMIGATAIGARRTAAFSSLYTLTSTALSEYQEEVKKTIGDKKEEEIRVRIAEEHMKRKLPDEQTVILTGNGNYLIYDKFSDRYFRSDIHRVKQAQADFNERLQYEGYLDINYLYDLLNLNTVTAFENFGWTATSALLHFRYLSALHPSTQEPVLVLDYEVEPKYQ